MATKFLIVKSFFFSIVSASNYDLIWYSNEIQIQNNLLQYDNV